MANRNVTDTEGRVWRRCAIPDGVTLANGESKERIEEELRKRNKGLKNKSEKQKIRQGEKPKSKEKSSQRMGRTSSNTIHPYGE